MTPVKLFVCDNFYKEYEQAVKEHFEGRVVLKPFKCHCRCAKVAVSPSLDNLGKDYKSYAIGTFACMNGFGGLITLKW